MTLNQLLDGIEVVACHGEAPATIGGLQYDSRKIEPGQLFVAIQGEVVDGNRFVQNALERGATGVLSERPCPDGFTGVWVQVAEARKALATAAANWFGRPAEALHLIGITGTNGKTTTAFLTDSLLRQSGQRTGLIGTIEYHIADRVLPSPHTTPESMDLQRLFAEMRDAGCHSAVLEASSHALAMDRVWGCRFDVAVFTNLTQDHLDYHGTMERYQEAKRRLFAGTGAGAPRAAVVNADDPASHAMVEGFPGEVLTYGFSPRAHLRASRVENSPSGLRFHLDGPKGWKSAISSPLAGRVNVLNMLAAMGAGLAMGLDHEVILEGVQQLSRVPGRFERVDEGQPFLVIVDYAHTPDALINVLRLAREIVTRPHAPGRVLTVFGCGGDRDRGKRPLMGAAAGNASDWVAVTSDNPRSEDPRLIINDTVVGLQRTPAHCVIEPDRRKAIRLAIAEAAPGDLVLIAGKGHEKYQILGTEKIHFDDVEEARLALQALGYGVTAGSGKQ